MRITPPIVIALLLCGIVVSVIIASLAVQYARTPLPAGRVDPMRLNNSEFRQLGLIATGNQQYILRMIAKEWFFDVGQRRSAPATISVPVGSRVTIVVTSMDVIHSLQVATHPVLLIRPGFIAQQTIVFDTAGTFPFICTYYCGPQHDAMRGSIIVTP
jgi:heme/copper-type cytochrome/quinol oxidase subunit 2